jgi:hypothetical protein
MGQKRHKTKRLDLQLGRLSRDPCYEDAEPLTPAQRPGGAVHASFRWKPQTCFLSYHLRVGSCGLCCYGLLLLSARAIAKPPAAGIHVSSELRQRRCWLTSPKHCATQELQAFHRPPVPTGNPQIDLRSHRQQNRPPVSESLTSLPSPIPLPPRPHFHLLRPAQAAQQLPHSRCRKSTPCPTTRCANAPPLELPKGLRPLPYPNRNPANTQPPSPGSRSDKSSAR